MIFERMQIGQVEIDNLLFCRSSGVTGRISGGSEFYYCEPIGFKRIRFGKG